MLRAARILALAFLTLWLSQPVAAQANNTPSETVERLNETLLEVMQEAQALGYAGRYDTLAPVLEEAFDFALMARVAVGRYWRQLDDAQKSELVDSFSRLSIATFAARFNGYSGEAFQVNGETAQRKNTVLVTNTLVKSSGETIPINYLLREIEGQWRIIDIYLDAKYSELALKRSEYSSVVERKGFEGLLDVMRDKIAEIAPNDG